MHRAPTMFTDTPKTYAFVPVNLFIVYWLEHVQGLRPVLVYF